MPNIRRRIAAAGAGLSIVALAVLGGAAPAAAASVTYTPTNNSTRAAAGWLATQFVDNTHLPAPLGDHFDQKLGRAYYANYGVNADVVFGLAAAKAAAAKINVALGYLARNVDAYSDITNSDTFGPYDGSVAKLALAALVAGKDPTHFGGYKLLQTLAADECPAKATTCTPGSGKNIFSSVQESFVILAEARAGGSSAPTAQALTYLTSLQCANGGFTDKTTRCDSGAADIDATSYAIMALHAARVHGTQVTRGVAWLRGQRKSGGYWISQGVPNANSTGLAAAALQGEGVNVSSSRAWLRSQQQGAGKPGAGAIRYADKMTSTTTSATSPSVLATAQALTGLVDGGGLATLSAQGASQAVPMFAPTASVSGGAVRAGQEQTVAAAGFVAGEKVRVSIHSAPVTVAHRTAGPLGGLSATYRVPAALTAGTHSVVLTGLTSGLSVQRPISVTAPPRASTSASASAGTASAGGSTSSTGPLAATGQDRATVNELTLIGVLAVAAGLAMAVAGRPHIASPAARHRRR